jgi:hypothetical protein
LLENGDTEQALIFADPGLNRVTAQGIMFLITLRQKNAVAADQRYAALLARTMTDPLADATAVSLLSSYVFTPSLLVTATRNGRLLNPWTDTLTAPDLAPTLRAMFFRVAAQVLLRPVPPPTQDNTSAGRAGTYFTIARLLPLFEMESPEHVPPLRAQLEILASDTPASYRADREEMLTAGLSPAAPARDELQEALTSLEKSSSTDERDRLYANATRAAAMKKDPRARELADKIEDPDLRERARAFVDFVAVRDAIGGKDAAEALRLARGASLSHIQRVWAYTEIARLLKKPEQWRAIELLNDALAEARRIDTTKPERAQALVAIATRWLEVDRSRVWETVAELIKAANSAADFTGEDGKVTARLQTRGTIAVIDEDVPSFNLSGLFGALAGEDLYRAIDLARSFKGETPRAVAAIAAARSVLGAKLTSSGQ